MNKALARIVYALAFTVIASGVPLAAQEVDVEALVGPWWGRVLGKDFLIGTWEESVIVTLSHSTDRWRVAGRTTEPRVHKMLASGAMETYDQASEFMFTRLWLHDDRDLAFVSRGGARHELSIRPVTEDEILIVREYQVQPFFEGLRPDPRLTVYRWIRLE